MRSPQAPVVARTNGVRRRPAAVADPRRPPASLLIAASTDVRGAVGPRTMNHDGCANGGGDPVGPEELAILRLVAEGLPMEAVALHVGMSSRTVRRRIRGVCDRLGVAHPIQAVVWAARRGLI